VNKLFKKNRSDIGYSLTSVLDGFGVCESRFLSAEMRISSFKKYGRR
jgi:hypothetical protein